jgi:hypothetical protein
MGRKIRSFEEWLVYVFDHPVDHRMPVWYFANGAELWTEGPIAIQYLTRLFQDPIPALALYTDAQINQGLWFLLDNSCSNHALMLLRPDIPWDERRRCVEAMFAVFERLFVARCVPKLAHIDEPGMNPLNSVCYMWFDLLPIWGSVKDDPNPSNRQLSPVMLDLMRRILDLKSIPCRESALHGLGHWEMYYPEKVVGIIDEFLRLHRGLRPDKLREYALAARSGCVL